MLDYRIAIVPYDSQRCIQQDLFGQRFRGSEVNVFIYLALGSTCICHIILAAVKQ